MRAASSSVSGVDGNRTAQDIGDELYALSPAEFTAARDGYVAEARNAGNRALATELAAMKRPTVSAGLANLVALLRPESVSVVLELGETIRAAQGRVNPTQLRDLSAQRRKELDGVVALAETLAAQRGDAPPSRAALTEVESTFAAAMADDGAARLVKSGRVLKALSYSGFGQSTDDTGGFAAAAAAVTTTGAATTAAPTRGHKPDAEAQRQAAEQAEAQRAQLRAEAVKRVTEARRNLADVTSAEADAESWGQRLADQIAELKQQLDVAQRDARTARQARIAAERDLASAQRRLDRLH